MSQLAITTGLAAVLSLALTPAVRRLAVMVGATDTPDARRVHQHVTPRAGGIAVALAVALALAFAGTRPPLGAATIAGAILLLVAGAVDDVWSLSPRVKLAAQLSAALLAVAGHLRFGVCAWATNYAITGLPAHVIDAAFTIAWIVFVTNAVNLSDGLDGLVSGLGIAGMVALAATALHGGDAAAAAAPLAIAGALLGFLAYNFNPASIFLGDAGSLAIGYALAVLPLAGRHGEIMGPLGAFLLVALPATDTVLTIARRMLVRCLPAWGAGHFWRGVVEGVRNTAQPDRRHIHHRLLDLGFNHRRAVLSLYLAACLTSGLGYAVAGAPIWPIDVFALCAALVVVGLVQALGIDELQLARTGLFLPVLHRLARHRRLIIATDVVLIVIAYAGANWLTDRQHAAILGPKLAIVVGVQLLFFRLLGVYRTVWWRSSMSDFIVLIRACVAAAIASYIVVRVCGLATIPSVALMHFLLFLPAVALMRFSHVLLANAARHAPLPERALICGTTPAAQHALSHLRRNGMSRVEPIGYVEVEPRFQGRRLGRLPVVGTLESLPALLRERRINHLVIADPSVRGEALRWARAVCRETGVGVHRYVERLRPLVLQTRNGTDHLHENGDGDAHGNGNGRTHENGTGPANGRGNGTPAVLEGPDSEHPREGSVTTNGRNGLRR